MKEFNLKEFNFNGKITGQIYDRFVLLDLDDVINILSTYLSEDRSHKISINGIIVKTSTNRLKRVVSNIRNFRDDIKPTFFSIERNMVDKNYHLNLYGMNEDGVIIMLNQNDIKGKV